MRTLTILLGVTGALSTLAADSQIVRGELTLGRDVVRGAILECGTNRAIEMGVMASNQYFGYSRRYDEVSGGGQFTVLVEVSGMLRRGASSSRLLVLDSPRIVAMTRGSCSDATPNAPPERARGD